MLLPTRIHESPELKTRSSGGGMWKTSLPLIDTNSPPSFSTLGGVFFSGVLGVGINPGAGAVRCGAVDTRPERP